MKQQANTENSKFGVTNRLDLRFVGSLDWKTASVEKKKQQAKTLDFPGNFLALDSGVDSWGRQDTSPTHCQTRLVKQLVGALNSMRITEAHKPTVADRLSGGIGRAPAILSQYPQEARPQSPILEAASEVGEARQ